MNVVTEHIYTNRCEKKARLSLNTFYNKGWPSPNPKGSIFAFWWPSPLPPPCRPPPPPPPTCPQKKWCRINSDTPQFLIKTSWAIKYSYFSIAVRTANLRTQDLTPFLDFLSTNGLSTASCCIIDHFTVMSLVPYPPSERDAEVDLVLIQTSFLFLWKSC